MCYVITQWMITVLHNVLYYNTMTILTSLAYKSTSTSASSRYIISSAPSYNLDGASAPTRDYNLYRLEPQLGWSLTSR